MAKALTLSASDRAADAGRGLLARLNKTLADYRTYRRTYAELASLTDRELADLGISRVAIRDIAREAVYGA
jgi:uncharacterized protein YjiS (DUF1127 family)